MRVLVLLRGLPGAGKSTWVEENGLKEYTVAPDDVRLLYASPDLDINGDAHIPQDCNKVVWDTVYSIVDYRLSNGDFTIVDSTLLNDKTLKRFVSIAKANRCRVICVDFSDVPIEECKRRNAMRDTLKYVPEEVIDRMAENMVNQRFPKGCRMIKPDEIEKILHQPVDFSKYKKIHHIGDMHGCMSVFEEAFPILKSDELYIFLGDYLDRGIQNANVLNFLLTIVDRENVILLEGNHERHLRKWAKGLPANSKVFEHETRLELEEAKINKTKVRALCSKLAQCVYYTYRGKEVFCCHGGISTSLHKAFTLISTTQLIGGTGAYEDCREVAKSWERENDIYQIHGHRNIGGLPIHYSDRVFNLQGNVERGGNLRIVTLSDDGFECREVANKVFAKRNWMRSTEITDDNMVNVVGMLRNSELIKEHSYGCISAFNFTRDAFEKQIWDDMSVRARGLYIDTEDNKVVARGYDKFFEIGERPETTLENIDIGEHFNVYVKENGYLGLMSYNHKLGKMLYMTKQMCNIGDEYEISEHVKLFMELVQEHVEDFEALENYLKNNDVTIAFEVIDSINDPHVIKYEQSKVVMLDIIENSINFKTKRYGEVTELGKLCGCRVKTLVGTYTGGRHTLLKFVKDFENNSEMSAEQLESIEGYVISDGRYHRYKLKTPYYKVWKHLRGVVSSVYARGVYKGYRELPKKVARPFYDWLMNNDTEDLACKNILELRALYFASKGKK